MSSVRPRRLPPRRFATQPALPRNSFRRHVAGSMHAGQAIACIGTRASAAVSRSVPKWHRRTKLHAGRRAYGHVAHAPISRAIETTPTMIDSTRAVHSCGTQCTAMRWHVSETRKTGLLCISSRSVRAMKSGCLFRKAAVRARSCRRKESTSDSDRDARSSRHHCLRL